MIRKVIEHIQTLQTPLSVALAAYCQGCIISDHQLLLPLGLDILGLCHFVYAYVVNQLNDTQEHLNILHHLRPTYNTPVLGKVSKCYGI